MLTVVLLACIRVASLASLSVAQLLPGGALGAALEALPYRCA